MKKVLFMTLVLFWSSLSFAKFEFSIPCFDNDGKPLPYAVVKAPFKNSSGKWDVRYFVEVKGQQPLRLELVSAGSGDEDYNEYNIKHPNSEVDIAGAYIQNKFAWVSLINNEGSSFANCEK